MVKVDIMEAEDSGDMVFAKVRIDDVVMEEKVPQSIAKDKKSLAQWFFKLYKERYREELMGEVEVK